MQINFNVIVFQRVANIERKKKIAFTQIYKGLVFYIGSVALLLGLLGLCSCAFVDDICAFVDDVCANLGVTFQKTQTISPLQALNP